MRKIKHILSADKLAIAVSFTVLLAACGGGSGSVTSTVPYITVNSNITQVQYPANYTTASASSTDINPCNISASTISYPQSWSGIQNLPTVTGAPLASGILTAMAIKDILPSGSLPSGCANPSNFSEFSKTVARLRLLNVNVIQVIQWHWAQINGDGSYKITGDTNGSLSDAELAQYVAIIRSAGMKVILSNQIQGFVDNSGVTNIATPAGNAANWGRWLNAFQTFMLERATKFQSLGIDYWEMGCNACVYGDSGDGSAAASQQFSDSYLATLNLVSNKYTGKKFIYETSWVRSNAQYLLGIDLIGAGLWTGNITSSDENAVTVASMKSKYIDSNSVASLNSLVATGKPVILFAGIQSRGNALSVPGYLEETMCTNSIGSITFGTSCIQNQTAANFALQAIVIEAQLETFSSLPLVSGSIVGISDYWQTDFMSAAGPTFPNIASSIRNKPAEGIVKKWFNGH